MNARRLLLFLCLLVGCEPSKSPTAARNESCGPALAAGASVKARQLLQTAHGGSVTSMALSADGYLATSSQGPYSDKTVRIWDLAQRTLLAVVHKEVEVAWDDEAHALLLRGGAEPSHDATTNDLLLAADGREIGRRTGGQSDQAVREGAFTRSNALLSGYPEHELIYRRRDGTSVRLALPTANESVDGLTLVAGGQELAATGFGQLLFWPVANEGKTPSTAVVREVDGLTNASFADNGDALVGRRLKGSNSWEVSVIPRDPSRASRVLTTSEASPWDGRLAMAMARDGRLAAVVASNVLTVFQVGTGKVAWSDRGGHVGDPDQDQNAGPGFSGVMMAHDGRTLIVALGDGTIALRDLASGRKLGILGAPVHQPSSIAWVDATHVLAFNEGRGAVWDLASGGLASSFTDPSGFWMAGVVAGDLVVVRKANCLGMKIARLDRWAGIVPPPELAAGDAPALDAVCASPDPASAWPPPRGMASRATVLGAGVGLDITTGQRLAATSPDSWAPTDAVRMPDGKMVRLAGLSVRPADSIDLVLRGGFLFSKVKLSSSSNAIGVWRTSDGAHLHDLTLPSVRWDGRREQSGVLLSVSPDGSRIAINSGGQEVGVFESGTGKLLANGTIPNSSIARTAAFGAEPGEAWIGSHDGAIYRLSSSGTVKALGNEVGADISQLVASPDGVRLAAVAEDGGIRILDAVTGRLAATLVQFGDEETIAFTPAGAYLGSMEAASRVGWLFQAPLEVFRFEQFAGTFHRPDAVLARLAGKADDVTTGLVRPPTVTIAVPGRAAPAARIDATFSSARRVDVVRAYREGREVASTSPCVASGTVSLDVPLLEGNNTISVQAFDDLGHASSLAVERVTRSGGSRPDLHLVAIGVGDYPQLPKSFQLAYATADADAIAKAFAADAGPGKRFGVLHAHVLRDRDVTVPSVLKALDALSSMKPDDLAIVFFAGHGVKPTPTDDMVLLTSPATLEPESQRKEGVGWGAMAERLARASGRVVVLLDACHSGHVSQNLVVPNDRLASELSRTGRAGVIVFAASKGRQSSYEPNGVRAVNRVKLDAPALKGGGDHGYFTAALLATLRDPASDRDGDGTLEMSEWVQATTDRVTSATVGLQTPWLARQEMFGDFGVVAVPATK